MTEIIYSELQDGYSVCPMCKFGKASVHSREAVEKTWLGAAMPAHLRIICMGCEHVALVKPGTIELTGLYIGAPK